jgi:RimJ/RimL family protein N-acetyltransferase
MNVELKPLDTWDYPCWWLDDETSHWMLHGSVARGPDYNKEYYEEVKSSRDTKVFKILVDDVHVGNCSLSHVDWIHRRAELGIVIWRKDYRGCGIGTRAANLLCEYAYGKLGLHQVWLGVVAENLGARKSYKKAGFTEYGYMRDGAWLHGQWHDIVYMQRLL